MTVGPGHTYSTITKAINAAHPGDNIYVYDNNGSSYTYRENIEVNKDNLTITGKGKVLLNCSNTDPDKFVGFDLENKGITVQNFTILGDGTTYGVFSGFNDTIKDNTFFGNELGVRVCGGNQIQILNNVFTHNDEAIYMDGSSNITISGNTISNCTVGVNSQGNDHYTIIHNTLKNLKQGMFIDGDKYAIIDYNTISTIMGDGIDTGLGMDVLCDYKVLVKYNSVSDATLGIYLRNIEQGNYGTPVGNPFVFNTIYQNSVTDCKNGIQLDAANHDTISYNSIKYTKLVLLRTITNGILSKGSSNNTIENNIISGNSYGLQITDYTYSDPTIQIKVSTNNNNTIKYNTINNNGIGIQFSTLMPTGNQVNFNRIVNNKVYALKNTSILSLIDARYNWWGSNAGPKTGSVLNTNFNPWLVLRLNANPLVNGVSNVTADLLNDSNGIYHDPTSGHVPNGISVTFTTTLGTINNPVSMLNGSSISTLTSGTTSGFAHVSAILDNQTVETSVKLPFKIISIIPVNNAKGVSTTSPITIKFSAPIKAGPNYAKIYVKDLTTGTTLSITKTIFRNTLTIQTTKSTSKLNTYLIYVPIYTITDRTGNNLTTNNRFIFRTGL